MATPNYPSSVDLIITFLNNVRRYSVNSISGMNPTLINVNGEQMFVYIKNLSPAQLSNDNPDVWRIQLPKRQEFDDIKQSDKMFVLFGYDYVRKVYTTWNPYWCKQRLNVAESCSMYSRLSLQNRVAANQKIEKMQLQKDGDVVCIPSALLASYLKNIRSYYPEESTYVPIGSSIQKRMNNDPLSELITPKNKEEELFDKFKGCYNIDEYRKYLLGKGYQSNTVSNYTNRLTFVFENGFLNKYEDLFLEYARLDDYKHAINKFCYKPDIKPYEDLWHKAIMASLKQYLLFAEEKLYGTQNIHLKIDEQPSSVENKPRRHDDNKKPSYTIDKYGKLIELDPVLIERLLPLVRGVDFPDIISIIKQIRDYYPEKVTEKMTPADWTNLIDSTKWQKRRGRKSADTKAKVETVNSVKEEAEPLESILTENNDIKNEGTSYDEVVPQNENSARLVVNRKLLDAAFDKKVTSYKYFWFVAIISLIKQRGKLTISYDDILIRMVALAWPIVLNDGIDLGDRDMLAKYLKDIQRKTYLISGASGKVVESSLYDYYYTFGIVDVLSPLLNNVPYRFLSPWVKYTSNEEVVKASQNTDFSGPYVINTDGIVFNLDWWNYIEAHYNEICSFTYKSFLNYAKLYNNELKLLKLMRSGWNMI